MISRTNFSAADLRKGCLLSTIAHAIFIAHNVELAHEQSWDGINYNIQDTQGALGTITFAKAGVVGAFFDLHSPRNPLTAEVSYDLDALLAEMPAGLRKLAEDEALQYLIQDLNGAEMPVITAIFWEEDGRLVSMEPWTDVLLNGAHLIETQLLPEAGAIDVWRSHYGFSQSQVALLQSLFTRKLAASELPLVLTIAEKAELLRKGSEGLDQTRELLAGVGIELP